MALFGRKSVDKERIEYIQFLKKLSNSCDSVVRHAAKTEHHDKLHIISEDIRYFLPSDKAGVREVDRRINNILGDLKILVVTNRDTYRIVSKIEDLESLIIERSSKL